MAGKGHVIECSTYATGGYYSGFKDLGVKDVDMGYPIAAIEANGEAVFTMEKVGLPPALPASTVYVSLTALPGETRSGQHGHHCQSAALRDPGPLLLQFRCHRPDRKCQARAGG